MMQQCCVREVGVLVEAIGQLFSQLHMHGLSRLANIANTGLVESTVQSKKIDLQ
jgi:hypothetical protein